MICRPRSRWSTGCSRHRRRPQIQAAAATRCQTLPMSSVLGDVDAGSRRLTALPFTTPRRPPPMAGPDGTSRRPDLPPGEALAVGPGISRKRQRPVEGRGRPDTPSSTGGRPSSRARPQDRRRAVEALFGRARFFNRRRGSRFATWTGIARVARAAKGLACERAELSRIHRLGGPACAAFRDLLASGRRGTSRQDVDDKLWHRFKAARTPSSRPATPSAPTRRRADRQRHRQGGLLAGPVHRHRRP